MTTSPGLTTTVHTVSPDDAISDVVRLMAANQTGNVIVTEDDRPIGVLTDRDIVIRVVGAGLKAKNVRVRQVMSQPAVTVSQHAEASDAIELMSQHGIRRLPIVDEHNRLVSILTMDDVLLLDLDNLPDLQEIIRYQRHAKEQRGPAPGSPKIQSSTMDRKTPRPPMRGLSRPVMTLTTRATVIRSEPTHTRRRQPKQEPSPVSAWLSNNRLWIGLLVLASLLGAAVVIGIERYGSLILGYNPQYYEPKGVDREIHRLQEEIRKLEGLKGK